MSETRRPLLIVEDDPALQVQMKWAFDAYEVAVASDREQAIAQLRHSEPPVVTLDLGLPPDSDGVSEGFKALAQILELAPDTKIIVLTGQNDVANALRAVSQGAHDFFAKPFEPGVLSLIIDRAFRMHELQLENRRLLAAQAGAIGGIITGAPEMLELCRMVEKVSSTDATVLLLGESGTGKELLARALHESSSRSKQRFVAINCAAIPDTLLESELFGYERGAFTGAFKQTIGRIETANKGTLFLDEIGDLPAALQAKLLRFLQERSIERLGGRGEIPIDVRIVCATHQNLQERIADGTFREDLFYRLAEVVITVPPLRDRSGDAVLIAHALARRVADDLKRGQLTIAADALDAAVQRYMELVTASVERTLTSSHRHHVDGPRPCFGHDDDVWERERIRVAGGGQRPIARDGDQRRRPGRQRHPPLQSVHLCVESARRLCGRLLRPRLAA